MAKVRLFKPNKDVLEEQEEKICAALDLVEPGSEDATKIAEELAIISNAETERIKAKAAQMKVGAGAILGLATIVAGYLQTKKVTEESEEHPITGKGINFLWRFNPPKNDL